MGCGCANMLQTGDKVLICSYEGFGGPGLIVDMRSESGSRFKVRMTTQPKDFWAWDFEIDELSDQNLVRNKRGVYYLIRSLLGRNK